MAKGKEIKRRIKSIGSMLQLTKAMELIASIKMKKAQEAALKSKTYVFESWRAIMKLTLSSSENSVLFNERESGKILALLVTSNRGLAGSYDNDILKLCLSFIKEKGLENIEFVTMGQKGKNFLKKVGGNIIADFPLGEQIRFTATSPIALIAWDGFMSNKYREFFSIHTHFESAGKKKATKLKILPLDIEKMNEESAKKDPIDYKIDFKFEPDKKTVLEQITRQMVRALTYQVILESEAAEQASRMIAMKNASDAAADLKEDFEFTYDQLRQQSITAELTEISAGVNAME